MRPRIFFSVSAVVVTTATLIFAYTFAPQTAQAVVQDFMQRILGYSPTPCLNLATKERYICWDTKIDLALTYNLSSAFVLLETFSRTFPDFINVCHTHAHRIGEQAYKEFREGASLTLSPAMQLCDFGFYHGFMTEFITQSREPLEMRNFCTRMEATEEDGSRSYSRDACFHGIGHGSVERHDPNDWGDPKAILMQTLELCQDAAANDHDYEKCAGGAYNGMSYGTYGKEILNKEDPFGICRGLSERDVPAECFGNLAAVVFDLTESRKLQQGIDLARSYQEYPYFERALATFAAMSAREQNSQQDSMRACNALSEKLAFHCLWGYVSGLIQSETPDSRQEKAYALCSGNLIPDEKRETCFEAAFGQLEDFWSEEKIVTSCGLAPESAQMVCGQALSVWREKKIQRQVLVM